MLYYTVFRTRWGYFGLAGTSRGVWPASGPAPAGGSGRRGSSDAVVVRTCLPVPRPEAAERGLLLGLRPADGQVCLDSAFLGDLQRRIVAYFEGEPVDFSVEPPVDLAHLSLFARKVLLACRRIPAGRTVTYRDLAEQIASPKAARAVGGAMAANPVPLIVPCHRVLRSDGGLGGFSAPGGTATKQRLLRHEQRFSQGR